MGFWLHDLWSADLILLASNPAVDIMWFSTTISLGVLDLAWIILLSLFFLSTHLLILIFRGSVLTFSFILTFSFSGYLFVIIFYYLTTIWWWSIIQIRFTLQIFLNQPPLFATTHNFENQILMATPLKCILVIGCTVAYIPLVSADRFSWSNAAVWNTFSNHCIKSAKVSLGFG